MKLANELNKQFELKYVLHVLNPQTKVDSYLFESNPLSYDVAIKEKERLLKQNSKQIITIVNYNKYEAENN